MTFLVLASFLGKQILQCTNVTCYFLLWYVLKHHELSYTDTYAERSVSFILTLFVLELKTRVRMDPFLCVHRDNHFRTRRTKYVLGINFRQKPTTLIFFRAAVRVMSSGMT